VKRADSDPWTVPQSVRDRFVQDGHRFYFPDGAPAFKDRGRRLTTASENTQVIHSLIEIAHSRGWTEVTLTGTERFRREAWRQARLEGLAVRGYRPSEAEQAQLVRALARGLARPADSVSADPQPTSPVPPEVRREAPRPSPEERYVGRLLDHGKDTYLHDPDAEPSYFVRLGIPGGYREVWGKDIERAVAKSLTQPELGDEVVLQRTGRDPVTVKRAERDAQGQIKHREVEAYHNRWVLEKREFFEQRAAAAQLVRDEAMGVQDAVQQHPELAGTYLNLRAAELAAQRLRDPQDQKRFVAQVRSALAESIERGEPLQPVRLRERESLRREKERAPLSRE
jgi:Large polyvalent protein-associated domain 7